MTVRQPATGEATDLGERLGEVTRRITNAGSSPEAVKVVAVTKGFGQAVVDGAVAAGLTDLGENYAAELTVKAGEVARKSSTQGMPGVRWHFLGAIQRNKVRALAPHVHLWQSVARPEEGTAIARWAPGAAVLVQVDPDGTSAGRNGCSAQATPGLVGHLRQLGLEVRGLMIVGRPGEAEGSRPGFRAVAGIAQRLGLPELSMGMTDDLEVAVQEGATMVRVGRALFGDRPPCLALGQ